MASPIVDCVLAPSALVTLLAYHVFLFHKVRTCPLETRMGINRLARGLWVREMRTENHKKNVLVVQTLRNSIMESILLATTAVMLIAALAAYFTFSNSFEHFPRSVVDQSFLSSLGTVSTILKSLSVLMCCVISFLCHTQSIRFYNHVTYMMNIPIDLWITSESIVDLLQKATMLYAIGCRTFYMALPLLLWVFGSVPMLFSGLVLLHILYSNDFPHAKSHDILQSQANTENKM